MFKVYVNFPITLDNIKYQTKFQAFRLSIKVAVSALKFTIITALKEKIMVLTYLGLSGIIMFFTSKK